MDRASTTTTMGSCTLGIGRTIRNMGRECTSISMGTGMWDNGTSIRDMDRALSTFQIIASILVEGSSDIF